MEGGETRTQALPSRRRQAPSGLLQRDQSPGEGANGREKGWPSQAGCPETQKCDKRSPARKKGMKAPDQRNSQACLLLLLILQQNIVVKKGSQRNALICRSGPYITPESALKLGSHWLRSQPGGLGPRCCPRRSTWIPKRPPSHLRGLQPGFGLFLMEI